MGGIGGDLLRRNKRIVRGSRGIRLGKPKGTIQCLINIKLRLKSGVDWDFQYSRQARGNLYKC